MGITICKPTSVVTSSGSATTSANGEVTFTSVASVSLNGVFKSDFRFYKVLFQKTNAGAGATNVEARLRSAGTDNTSSYNNLVLSASGTSLSTSEPGATGAIILRMYGTWAGASEIEIFSPFQASPTSFLVRNISDSSYASIYEGGCRHATSASYDGITLATGSSMTGRVIVYGYNQ